ncbi:L-fucose:H+ symporter permease [Mucilaginibacter dorajii]|uniref:L-fucose:H+ symporter permease n=1 Tax=Mucilaginibacter dorajii TaxID=692994 RepID=A0ABP7P3H2_9SPHI|nr:L-fucose:H+ symporter permease [Mucilaginibacter dorajii]MCS3734353.1 FHS family L-fucose permease-like MFS transporter [Mucilaginibacter dorajii]
MSTKPNFTERKYLVVLIFVTSLFLMWGVSMTLGDVLNRHFQNVLHITKSRSALVQFSIFGAYFVMGIPAGMFMKRFGYKSGVLMGLILYSIGAFLFIPAANAESFTFFRIALFVLACGMATLETVAHPFIASLGDQRTSDQRINFSQAFNGVGGVIGPVIGSYFILKAGQEHSNDLVSVKHLYIIIGAVIAVVALCFSFLKVPPVTDPHAVSDDSYANDSLVNVTQIKVSTGKRSSHFIFAAITQLFNVAAQGGTWAFFINYGHDIMHFSDENAGYYFSLSMVMMIVGRFAGTYLMRFIKPYKLLATFAFCNIIMCVIVAQGFGWPSFVALLFINFFFSIMFPTIFSLGIKDMGADTQFASSLIVMGVVGGGLFPYLMGLIANHNVATAYYLPIICYLVIFAFGFMYPRLNKKAV